MRIFKTSNCWSEQDQAFSLLKEKLKSKPLLQYTKWDQIFILTTDSSNFAVGAFLSRGNIPDDLPIAYASRKLNCSEINYTVTEKELCAIIFGAKHFRPYLYGRTFIIVTDHRPLTFLMNVIDPGSRLIRWRLKLEYKTRKPMEITTTSSKPFQKVGMDIFGPLTATEDSIRRTKFSCKSNFWKNSQEFPSNEKQFVFIKQSTMPNRLTN